MITKKQNKKRQGKFKLNNIYYRKTDELEEVKQEPETLNTVADERELKTKLAELEKELALSDEEFEKRLIERLKKGKFRIH